VVAPQGHELDVLRDAGLAGDFRVTARAAVGVPDHVARPDIAGFAHMGGAYSARQVGQDLAASGRGLNASSMGAWA
jgi:hypothetical protein